MAGSRVRMAAAVSRPPRTIVACRRHAFRYRMPRSRRSVLRAHTLGAYVALTKPRIIELLLVTTLPTMVLAADGWPGAWLMVWTLDRRHAVRRRRKRLQQLPRSRHRRGHEAHQEAAARDGRGERARGLDVRVDARRRVDRVVLLRGRLAARRRAVCGRDPRVHRGLHDDPQAPDVPEHRVGRRGGLHARADRLGRGDAVAVVDAGGAVPHHLLLDAAALLAARAEVPGDYREAQVPMLPVVASTAAWPRR